MTQNEKEWMDRYIYQVVRRLPKDQRDEVSMELQELISDMLEQSDSMESVLTELGDPAEFAKKYRDDADYLIGPEYYDSYQWFMKVVLICTLAAGLSVSLLEGFAQDFAGVGIPKLGDIIGAITAGLTRGITDSIISCISVFGGVTILFAVIERKKIKLERKGGDHQYKYRQEEGVWSPKSLAGIPDKKAMINRGDSIIGIVAIVSFCMLLIMSPGVFSVAFKRDGELISIQLFNLGQWDKVLPFFIATLLVGLADEVLKLIMGVYCRLVMYSCIFCGAIQLILSFVILKVLPFWNPDFGMQVKIQTEGHPESEFVAKWLSDWDGTLVSNLILSFIIVLTLAETGIMVFRTMRYGIK